MEGVRALMRSSRLDTMILCHICLLQIFSNTKNCFHPSHIFFALFITLQFWNCAEIRIVGKGGASTPASRPVGSPAADDATGADIMTTMTEEAVVGPPTAEAPTPSPTVSPPCANAASTYYEASEDCTGYYICRSGEQGEIHLCSGGGMLYDEAKQMCNW